MQSILLATLGESPVVVSGMVNVLCEQEGISLDTVQIIYPDEPNERWIGVGYELLERHFKNQGLHVEAVPLSFADAHTEDHSLEFLQVLNGLLLTHESLGNDVYLSLAGGRKHISALMAMLTQFYPNIKALYHLHDTQEHNPRKQYSIEFLEKHPDRLNQPASRFRVIHLPCEHITNGVALRQWLSGREQDGVPAPISISPEAESFYGVLFQKNISEDPTKLEVWLTQTAYDQYCQLLDSSSSRLQVIDTYLKDMMKSHWHLIPKRIHDHAIDPDPTHIQDESKTPLHHFTCKKARTAERVFYYTQPNAITAYPKASVKRVIITRFPVHVTDKKYDIELRDWVRQPDITPVKRAMDLPSRPIVLIAPLGESPMVVTQAYTLLQSPQHVTRQVKVQAIHIVYPDEFEPARNGAAMLHAVCEKHTITLHQHPLPIPDLDSDESIRHFISGLTQAITDVRQQYPDADCALLISGGRKGMSAVAFYVAQVTGITRVYHTTISDPDLDEKIRDITAYDTIKSKSTTEQAELLFLNPWDHQDFTLITVPIISLATVSGG
jgi:hypothetical protein